MLEQIFRGGERLQKILRGGGVFQRILVAVLLSIVLAGSDARAQAQPDHRLEITPYYGGVWSRGRDVLFGGRVGTLRTEASGMGGVAVDLHVGDDYTWVEVLYNRQVSRMNFELADQSEGIADLAIEYYHVGGVIGVERKRAIWYTSFTLGTTRYAPQEQGYGDEWRFSIGFGLGAKYYFGKRIGLRIQGRAPYTFTGGDQTEFICGDNGCVKNGGGVGLWQFDASVGLIIRL